MNALSVVSEPSLAELLQAEELTTREWARLLVLSGISGNETAASRVLRQQTTATTPGAV